MKILFLIGALLSAVLLTLPPFVYRQIPASAESVRAVIVSDAAESLSVMEPLMTVQTEAASDITETMEQTETASAARKELQSSQTVPPIETETAFSVTEDIPAQTDNKSKPVSDPALSVGVGHDSRIQLQITGMDGILYPVSMRSYLIGVVMAEMPSYFHTQALCAQAVAARSYLLYRQEHGFAVYDYGSSCTAHFTEEEGIAFFGDAYESVLETITAAVDATDGQVLYYDDEICCTAYHAMSYSCTEEGVVAWGGDTPYLTSVPTPESGFLSGMTTTAEFDEASLCRLLGVDAALPLVLTYSDAGRVVRAETASGDVFSGDGLRLRLSLRSTAITVSQQSKESVELCIRGFGHGVGMSQYGADLYADAGWSYAQILSHYYPSTVLGLAQ